MYTDQPRAVAPGDLRFLQPLIVRVADAECSLVVSQPSTDRALWNEYLAGAQRSYSEYGVECVLDIDAVQDGVDTTVFFAALDATGRVVAGARAVGPLRSAEDSHALVEWAGSPRLPAVRKMIADRLPFGVVELKTAWVASDAHRRGALAATLARTPLLTMTLFGVQFAMATAAAHVLDRWRSAGGVVASRIPATPYPDERYRTKMMWWDRSSFANHAEPQQLARTLAETGELMRNVELLAG